MPIFIFFNRLCCMVLFASFFDVGALALKYFTVNLLHSISKASYQKSLVATTMHIWFKVIYEWDTTLHIFFFLTRQLWFSDHFSSYTWNSIRLLELLQRGAENCALHFYDKNLSLLSKYCSKIKEFFLKWRWIFFYN